MRAKLPEPHPLTAQDEAAYFEDRQEPTQDDAFVESVRELLQQWPRTRFAAQGMRWKDAVLDVALQALVDDPTFRKRSGELNIHQLATRLGVDHKTTKLRLKELGLS